MKPEMIRSAVKRQYLLSSSSQPDQRQLLQPGHGLDCRFPLQCRTPAGMTFLVNRSDRAAATSVSRGGPGIVLLAAAAYVLGDASVQRTIGTSQHVDEPRVGRRLMRFPLSDSGYSAHLTPNRFHTVAHAFQFRNHPFTLVALFHGSPIFPAMELNRISANRLR